MPFGKLRECVRDMRRSQINGLSSLTNLTNLSLFSNAIKTVRSRTLQPKWKPSSLRRQNSARSVVDGITVVVVYSRELRKPVGLA